MKKILFSFLLLGAVFCLNAAEDPLKGLIQVDINGDFRLVTWSRYGYFRVYIKYWGGTSRNDAEYDVIKRGNTGMCALQLRCPDDKSILHLACKKDFQVRPDAKKAAIFFGVKGHGDLKITLSVYGGNNQSYVYEKVFSIDSEEWKNIDYYIDLAAARGKLGAIQRIGHPSISVPQRVGGSFFYVNEFQLHLPIAQPGQSDSLDDGNLR